MTVRHKNTLLYWFVIFNFSPDWPSGIKREGILSAIQLSSHYSSYLKVLIQHDFSFKGFVCVAAKGWVKRWGISTSLSLIYKYIFVFYVVIISCIAIFGWYEICLKTCNIRLSNTLLNRFLCLLGRLLMYDVTHKKTHHCWIIMSSNIRHREIVRDEHSC